ncbi:MAG TPA: lanthionine synthetase LanC family protein [Thermoanaerobaculia bacterium]
MSGSAAAATTATGGAGALTAPAASPPTAAWRPLLDGALAERAHETVLAVAEALRDPAAMPAEAATPGLSRGHAGRAVLFAYLAEALGEPAWGDAAGDALDAAVEALGEQTVGPGLFGGFAGVGWAVEHLAGRLFPAAEAAAATEEIGTTLAGLLAAGWPGPYDLIDGLAGFALFALEGLPRPEPRRLLEQVLAEIGRRAVSGVGGRTWFTPPELVPARQRELAPAGYHNLGLAHGVPGVIAVLARAVESGVGGEAAHADLSAAVAWLLAREQPPSAGSCYANWLPAGDAAAPPETTRIAWCYGDLGVAAALSLAAQAAGRDDWAAAALRVARRAAARPAEGSGVLDAGLCHGAAGAAHLFARLAAASGDAALAQAARRWYAAALDLRRAGEGDAGYLSWEPARGGWTADRGFLAGAAGIALALAAAIAPAEPGWDRMLGISSAVPEEAGSC